MSVDLEDPPLGKDTVLTHIPAFPPIVLRVLDLLSGEKPDLVPLVREIGSDASLSAQVLRVANSPLFGLTAQVDTVHRAVVTLGSVRVQSLVMAVATSNYMKEALRTQALERCWRHTLASAILCRELAQAAGLPGDRAYSFGLLHDIGRLGLLVAYPHSYDRLLQTAGSDSLSLLDLEKKQFGMDHCEAGCRLAEEWNLPPDFRLIAGGHHHPPAGAPFDSLQLVHGACLLADALGYSVAAPAKDLPLEEILSLLPVGAREHLAEDSDSLRKIVERAIGQDETLFDTPEEQPSRPAAASPARKLRGDPIPPPEPAAPPISRTWGAVLLVAMVLLVLAAGIFCLWNA